MGYFSVLKTITSDIKIYIVGGFIRNYLLNKALNDIDLIVFSSNVEKVVKEYIRETNFNVITLDQKRNIYRVVTDQNLYIDFSSPVSQDLYQDLGCRDFTINSMAVNLCNINKKNQKYFIKKRDIIDPFGGLIDLDNQMIRMVNNKFVKDDPLRILRAFRFSNNLDFNIEKRTKKVINVDLRLLIKVKNERIKEELKALFKNRLIPERFKEFLKNELVKVLFDINTYQSSENKSDLITGLKYFSQNNLLEKINIENYFINLILLFLIPSIKSNISLKNIKNKLINYSFNKKKVNLIIDYLYTLKEMIRKPKSYEKNPDMIYDNLFHKQTESRNLRYFMTFFCNIKSFKDHKSINKIIGKLNNMRDNTKNKLINGNEIKQIFNLNQGEVIGEILREVEKKQALKKLNSKQEVINYINRSLI